MFSLASLGLLARGAGAARVGSGSSSPQETPNQQRGFQGQTLMAQWKILKLELSKRLSHCRIWLCFHLHGQKKQDETEGQLSWTVLLLFFREVCCFYISIDCARGMQSSFHYLKCYASCVTYYITHTLYGDLGLSWSVWFLRFCCIFSNHLHKYCVCVCTLTSTCVLAIWITLPSLISIASSHEIWVKSPSVALI